MTNTFHLFTVDVEDWPQSTLDHSLPIGPRVVANTKSVLDLLAESKVQATFFVLGKVAEMFPTLARDIVAAGHEVGTHGYSHEAVDQMSAKRFREELHRSVDLLRQQVGQPVLGHRAADFSISESVLPYMECLVDEGLIYDSSIFPVRHPRYGIPGAPRIPHLIRCRSRATVVEFPPATFKFSRFILPAAGGGYLRLFPYSVTKNAVAKLQRESAPATCYIHPYELDVFEKRSIPHPIPIKWRWTQFGNRRSVRSKLVRLLREFSFTTVAQACKIMAPQLRVALDLGIEPISYGNAASS